MFDKLDDLLIRFEELMSELSEPDVANNPERFRKLMKEQSDLAPIVAAYKEYKQCKQNIADSLAMLDEESDEEMRELAKEELNDAKARVEELEHELKILLLPKDPNDDKNVIVEIRAGAGGDEAALFAAEVYRMYVKYAESRRWRTEMMSLNENGIGGFKEVTFMITGQGAYSKMKYESGVHRVQRAVAVDVLRIHIPDLPREQGHGLQHHMECQQASDALFPQNAAAEAFAAQKAQIRRTAQLDIFYQLMQPDRFCRGAVQHIAQPLAQCRRADDQKQGPGDILALLIQRCIEADRRQHDHHGQHHKDGIGCIIRIHSSSFIS